MRVRKSRECPAGGDAISVLGCGVGSYGDEVVAKLRRGAFICQFECQAPTVVVGVMKVWPHLIGNVAVS
jgi:hypothetical protein